MPTRQVVVPQKNVALIVGKQGRTLARINKMFGCSAEFAKSKSAVHILEFAHSDHETLEKCESYISAMLNPELEFTLPSMLSTDEVGRFVGKAGSAKERIESSSGALVQVLEDGRVVAKGKAFAVVTAVEDVRHRIAQIKKVAAESQQRESAANSDATVFSLLLQSGASLGVDMSRLEQAPLNVQASLTKLLSKFSMDLTQSASSLSAARGEWEYEIHNESNETWGKLHPLIGSCLHKIASIRDQEGFIVVTCMKPAKSLSPSSPSTMAIEWALKASIHDSVMVDQITGKRMPVRICPGQGSPKIIPSKEFFPYEAMEKFKVQALGCTGLRAQEAILALKNSQSDTDVLGEINRIISQGSYEKFVCPSAVCKARTGGQDPRLVLVDGMNVALRKGSCSVADFSGLIECVNKFTSAGMHAMVLLPASRLVMPPELQVPPVKHVGDAISLFEAGKLIPLPEDGLFVPDGSMVYDEDSATLARFDDLALLALAADLDAAIVSNDTFQTVLESKPQLRGSLAKLVQFSFQNDEFLVDSGSASAFFKSVHGNQDNTNVQSSPEAQGQVHEETADEWKCPLSGMVMQDPVLAADGVTYERKHISEWLLGSNCSPVTMQPLTSRALRPNSEMKNAIQNFLAAQANSKSRS